MATCFEDRFCDLDRDAERVGDALQRCLDDCDCWLSHDHADGVCILSLNLGVDLNIETDSDVQREVIRLLETLLAEVRGAA